MSKTETAVEIKRLVMRVGEKDLTLTVDEAKKLHAALEELFAKKVVVEERHIYHEKTWPTWYWNYPAITYISANTTAGNVKWLCSSGDNTISYQGKI